MKAGPTKENSGRQPTWGVGGRTPPQQGVLAARAPVERTGGCLASGEGHPAQKALPFWHEPPRYQLSCLAKRHGLNPFLVAGNTEAALCFCAVRRVLMRDSTQFLCFIIKKVK